VSTPVHRAQCNVTAILVMYGLPRLLTGCIIAHELMHAWLRMKGVTGLNLVVEEGLCQLMALLWLDSQDGWCRWGGWGRAGAAAGGLAAGLHRGGRSAAQRRTAGGPWSPPRPPLAPARAAPARSRPNAPNAGVLHSCPPAFPPFPLPRSQHFQERLSSYLAYQIRSDLSPIYGDGFRAAYEAFQVVGLKAVVLSVLNTGKLPRH
jgi:hypothetical protein